jgi:hypothetical protein
LLQIADSRPLLAEAARSVARHGGGWLTAEALAAGFTPDPDAVLVHFAETVSPEEAEVLRQILNDHNPDDPEDHPR